jgi:tRNA G18 (ribose-2'-O)-methylase SpoU
MLHHLTDIDDPRLADFREIKDKPLVDRGLFLAEGENVVVRLLRSELRVRAIVLAEKKLSDVLPHIAPGIDVYVLPGSEVSRLLGFTFHSGVIALGVVPGSPPLEHAVPRTGPARIVVFPEISAAENLGTLIRLAAGLGADAILCGERCTDPWLRRTVRVSMGAAFTIPIVRSTNILHDLHRLRHEMGVETVATVLDSDAEVLSERSSPDRVAVLFGSEAQGLRPEESAACTRKVRIPMHRGTDSLNVALAAAICLWELF